MNILLTSADGRSYLVQHLKETLRLGGCGGLIRAVSSCQCPAFACANRSVIMPIIYDQGYIPFLLEYCKREKVGMLIPLFDIDVPALTAHGEAFASAGTMVTTADPEAVGICSDKWRTRRALAKVGTQVPAAWLDRELALGAIRDGRTSWPLMVKPRWDMRSISVYQTSCREEMEVFAGKCRRGIQESYLKYEAMADQERCALFQQKIKGLEYGLDVINDLEGGYCTTIVKRKTAMRFGETDAAGTVEDRELFTLGEHLGILIKRRGNLDVDVLKEDGRYYVLEMNARFRGGYPFSHATGMNLPLVLALWAMGRELPPGLLTARTGVKTQKDICMLV